MLTSPGHDPAGNPRNRSQNESSSAPVINQSLVQGTRVYDPPNVPALTNRSDIPKAQAQLAQFHALLGEICD